MLPAMASVRTALAEPCQSSDLNLCIGMEQPLQWPLVCAQLGCW